MTAIISIDDQFVSGSPTREPRTFIQWKGTNVCMDFYCECGAHCHFDGYFAYCVKCPHCQTVWEMPCHVFPRKADHRTYGSHIEGAKMLEADEDHCDGDGQPVELAAKGRWGMSEPTKPPESPALALALELYWANETPKAEGALERLIELLKASPWRPIAEAPRDGTYCLGYDGHIMAVIEWRKEYNKFLIAHVGGWECDDDFDQPTHFMLLPDPPE